VSLWICWVFGESDECRFKKKDISLRNGVLFLQPMEHLLHMLEWLIGTTIWLFAEISLWHGTLTEGEYFIPSHQWLAHVTYLKFKQLRALCSV
jgi:hypothetical protein